jgi:probable F420-dependent oxidoreductase
VYDLRSAVRQPFFSNDWSVGYRTREMRLGIACGQARGFSYGQMREFALAAEAAGFESFFIVDHFYSGIGADASPDRDCLEAWTLLAALARDTTRIRLGTLVTSAPFRNPALLAKIVATVDQIADGRIEFGVGAGNKPDEFKAYGYAYLSPAERIEQLAETIEICKLLWTTPRASYEGRYYQVRDAVSAPKPRQAPHPPITIGGTTKALMRLAARSADGFDYLAGTRGRGQLGKPAGIDDLRQVLIALDAASREVGRQQRPQLTTPQICTDAEVADVGDARATLVQRVREYTAIGLHRFVLALPTSVDVRMIHRLAHMLIPVVTSSSSA